MNDLKLGHLQQEELDRIINQLSNVFGSKGELLAASYGKIHEYLGMTIDWSVDGRVMFTMCDYLKDILAEAPDEFDSKDMTPTVSDLFQVNEVCQKLDVITTDLFHYIVTRFIFVAKRARPDSQVAVAFLCNQVKSPNVED